MNFYLALSTLILGMAGSSFASKGAVPPSSQLPNFETVEAWCQQLGKELASVDAQRCISRPWKIEARSNGQIMIPHYYLGPEDGRRVLILGGIHGDEISSVSLVFRWMDFLDKVPQDSPLRQKRYVFLPLLNPDGYWSRPRTRTNLSGVDLNRNFATKTWSEDALNYWIKKTHKDKRRFPGHGPASEVETQYIQEFINKYKPEIIVSVHAPYGILDHDGAISFPKNIKSPLPVKTLGSFPGSLGRWAGIEKNIPVITVELMTATTMPKPKAIEELFEFVLNSKASGPQSVVR